MNAFKPFTAILQKSRIAIDDVVVLLPSFTQTTGLAQVDYLSLLLVFILLKALSDHMGGPRRLIEVILYADDLLIYGLNRFQVQQALARPYAAVLDMALTVNLAKTELV